MESEGYWEEVYRGENVRQIPMQQGGILCILRMKEGMRKNVIIKWHNNINESDILIVKGEDLTTFCFDRESQTLLLEGRMKVLNPEKTAQKREQSFVLLYPVDLPSSIVSMLEESRMKATVSVSHLPDEVFGIYENFSKITSVYRGIGNWLRGGMVERPQRRDSDYGGEDTSPLNPWIQSRKLELPVSRRGKRPMKDNCSEAEFKIIMFTSGSLNIDERRENWLRLFKNTSLTTSAAEYYQLLKEAQLAVSDDVIHLIKKDIFRTDRQVPFYSPKISDLESDCDAGNLASLVRILTIFAYLNPEICYVQGLNDILSPILYTMQSETLSFDIFSEVMSRGQGKYYIEDGSHMQRQLSLLMEMLRIVDPQLHDQFTLHPESSQLFIAYRWLLLLFKREVGFDHFPIILETIYSAPSPHYELFIALALLLIYRNDLIKIASRFDLTLQFYADRSGLHDVEAILSLADQLHQYFMNSLVLRHDASLSPLYT